MSEPTDEQVAALMEMQAMHDEPLLPELQEWVEEDGPLGAPMLRHPLVYDMFVSAVPGQTNRTYLHKTKEVAEAALAGDWHRVVFTYERPYRLNALIDYVTGRYDNKDDADPESIIPLSVHDKDTLALAADVWVDSENIQQNEAEWRALFAHLDGGDLWLGTDEERAEFDALPDPIPAWRGGIVGDWSWTTSKGTAQFFARRSGYPVRETLIPKADCFGYFTRRSEYELLVRLTPEREPLVYPDRFPETRID